MHFLSIRLNLCMKRFVWALWVVLPAQILSTGCATRHPASGTEALASLPDSPVTVWVAEPTLAKKIVILREKVEQGPAGATMVRVEIENSSTDPLEFEAQTLYKDLKGRTLNTSPWVRYVLKPGKTAWLIAPTIAPGTARFFIQIQPTPSWKPLSGPSRPNFGLVPAGLLQYASPSC